MTNEKALKILREPDRIGANLIQANDEKTQQYNSESIEALQIAIYALEKQTNTAEWIFPESVTGRYKCSHCRGNADRTTRFCPYCGYIMSNYNGKAE